MTALPLDALSVLRRLWDELGPKEQRWLPVALERDVREILAAAERAEKVEVEARLNALGPEERQLLTEMWDG